MIAFMLVENLYVVILSVRGSVGVKHRMDIIRSIMQPLKC